jgi:hypothetical protein
LTRRARHSRGIARSAPRYDHRILDTIFALDDGETSIAEICRQAGRAANACGLARPSYVHVRRVVLAGRETTGADARRRAARRRILADATLAALLGFRVDVYDIRRRVANVDER